jgi:hypothetical protein
MPKNSGDVFGAGVRILLVGPNEPLQITGNGGHVACLRFVDSMGNTLIPEYDPQMLLLPEGSIAGAKITIPPVSSSGWTINPVVTTLGNYQAAYNEFVRVDLTGAGMGDTIVVDLPPADAGGIGQPVAVRDIGSGHSGTLQIDSGGPDIMPDGTSVVNVVGFGGGITLVWDGTYWVREGGTT